jgi:hypothetical protein
MEYIAEHNQERQYDALSVMRMETWPDRPYSVLVFVARCFTFVK